MDFFLRTDDCNHGDHWTDKVCCDEMIHIGDIILFGQTCGLDEMDQCIEVDEKENGFDVMLANSSNFHFNLFAGRGDQLPIINFWSRV